MRHGAELAPAARDGRARVRRGVPSPTPRGRRSRRRSRGRHERGGRAHATEGGGGGGGGAAGNDTAGWGIWSSWQLSNEQDPDNTDTLYGFTFSIYNYTTAHYGNMQDKSGHIRWNGTTLGRLTQWMNSNFQNNPGDFWERVCSASISQDGSQGWDGRSNYYSNTLDNSAYGSSGPGTGEFYQFVSYCKQLNARDLLSHQILYIQITRQLVHQPTL